VEEIHTFHVKLRYNNRQVLHHCDFMSHVPKTFDTQARRMKQKRGISILKVSRNAPFFDGSGGFVGRITSTLKTWYLCRKFNSINNAPPRK
jgi:hypothetical protein